MRLAALKPSKRGMQDVTHCAMIGIMDDLCQCYPKILPSRDLASHLLCAPRRCGQSTGTAGRPRQPWPTSPFRRHSTARRSSGWSTSQMNSMALGRTRRHAANSNFRPKGAPECQFAGSGRSSASTLPSAGGKPWRIHSGCAQPRQSCESRLCRRWRAMRSPITRYAPKRRRVP